MLCVLAHFLFTKSAAAECFAFRLTIVFTQIYAVM